MRPHVRETSRARACHARVCACMPARDRSRAQRRVRERLQLRTGFCAAKACHASYSVACRASYSASVFESDSERRRMHASDDVCVRTPVRHRVQEHALRASARVLSRLFSRGLAHGNLASACTLDCAIQAEYAAGCNRVSNSASDVESGDVCLRTLARQRVRARAYAPGAERALHVRIRTRPPRERQCAPTMSGGNRILWP